MEVANVFCIIISRNLRKLLLFAVSRFDLVHLDENPSSGRTLLRVCSLAHVEMDQMVL